MVRRFNINNKDQAGNLLEFLKTEYSPDFFHTENNIRTYIETEKMLRKFIKDCKEVWIQEGETELNGVIVIWTAKGGNVERNYIKLAAKNFEAADALLSVLVWNSNEQLFTKILKNNYFLNLFYRKGFKFLSGRGKQLLLKRDKFTHRKKR